MASNHLGARPERKNSTVKTHSILGLLPLFEAIEAAGKDPAVLLRQHGITLDAMTGAAVISQEVELAIVSDAMALVKDPLLGIKVGSQVTFTSFGTYAMLLLTADTFLDSCREAVQFQSLSLLFSTMTMHLDQTCCEMRYTLPDADPGLRNFMADRDFMGTYIFIREFLSNVSEVMLGAGTARSKPGKEDMPTYRNYIDFDVEFNQPYNWFRIPTAILRTKQKHRNHWAHKLYRLQAHELMRKFYPDATDVVAQIRQIIDGYESHYPSVPEIARMFGVSERTLRRKLDEAGIGYRELVDARKKHLAISMLARKDVNIAELAETLGYTESASFLRAFKRWTGCTPKQFVQARN